MSFVKRKINVTIQLGQGDYGEELGEATTLEGYRVSARIVAYNGDMQGQLQLRIWGMPLDMINKLTKVGPIMSQRRNNRITVTAGDVDGAMSTVYEGTIDRAFGELQNAPEVVFNVIALSAGLAAIKPVKPSSYDGLINVSSIMADLSKLMGFAFENNGVTAQLESPYFAGTALNQVKACAEAANIYYTIDRGILAIWPKPSNRGGDPVQIDVDHDMVGYPAFSGDGITLVTLFNPNLKLGGRVNVNSILTVACGIWNIYKLAIDIESEKQNGSWFTSIECYRLENG